MIEDFKVGEQMRFEELNKNHLGEISGLFVKAFNGPPWNEAWSIETSSKRLSRMIGYEGAYGLVAYEDKKLVGMVLGHEEQFYNGVVFEIKEFCVDITLGSKGIGTKMYNELEGRLKDIGIEEISLVTCRSDKTIGFYEKQGFKVSDNIIIMNKSI